ncbi:hypothetical protein VCHC50A2_1574B, partial [Vibrio cholerae HC-50A2]
TGRLN